jgi:hypothetical protein
MRLSIGSIRVTPGVRVRLTSRGVRTSIGPRVARLHVGAGRTGVSTGAGPVTAYTSAGSSRRGVPRSPQPSGSDGSTIVAVLLVIAGLSLAATIVLCAVGAVWAAVR